MRHELMRHEYRRGLFRALPSSAGAGRANADRTMELSWWLSIGIGVGVIGVHAAARILTHRVALRASDRRTFLLVELGGLGGRMALVFGAVALILLFAPVHAGAFVGTVIVLLIVSMIVETGLIVRHMDRGALGS